MSPELTPLIFAAILQLVQIRIAASAMTRENGLRYNLSPRDTEPKLGVMTGRLKRAAANHAESLLLFAIAVICVVMSGKSSQISQIAAWTYLAARVIYVPAYAFGWVPWRSVCFLIGVLSIVTLLVLALL